MTNDKKLTLLEVFHNNMYAMKLGCSISKNRVLHALLMKCIYYFEWIFFSAFFLRYIVNALDKKADFQSIFIFILICGGVFFLINLYNNYAENVIYPLTSVKLYYGIYRKLYAKAKNVELRCYEDSDFYNRYTMAIDNAGDKVTSIIDSIWGIVTGVVATVLVFYAMFDISPFSVLFIISPIIGNFVFGNFLNKLEFRRYQESVPNDKVMNYVNRVMYLPDYAKEIRLSKVFRLLKYQYQEATDRTVKIAGKYAFKIAWTNLFRLIFTFTVIFEGILLYAVYENLVRGTISLAELTVMSSLMVSSTWILIGLFENIMNTMKNGLFVKNLRGFLEYKERIPEDQNGITPSDELSSIEFEHVSFSYKEEYTIKDLSFVIRGGEIVAFVGHNGAGKSTIIKLLLRLYDPTEGVIRLNGIDIKEYNLHAYRNLFAAAFQDYRIMGMTVKDNVLMGRHYEDEDTRVIEALKKVGVYERIMSLHDGVNTMMTREFDDKGAVLSGGESQKVVVARAFAKPAPVKVFDEPSSALDPIAEYELYDSIMKDGENRTMIFISHRLSSVKNADKVLMLEKGQIIEEGTHRELMKRNGSYAEMYQKQAMNYLAVDTVEGVEL
jgi:ATP-binding cassette, subfamily B, bacterial